MDIYNSNHVISAIYHKIIPFREALKLLGNIHVFSPNQYIYISCYGPHNTLNLHYLL